MSVSNGVIRFAQRLSKRRDTLSRRNTLRSDFQQRKYIPVNPLVDRRLQCFVQTLRFGTEFASLLSDEIEHFLKQTRTRFWGRLRPNARIQPQCQCHSPTYASVDCQRSGRWHDSNIARGGPRRAWFGATLPVEVTLAFKLGQSGLLTHIEAMGSVSLCTPMKS
jgi:hypothetical protein